jgi:hypothetical protein
LDPIVVTLWQGEFRHSWPPIERIIAQTERRVLHGKAVAANEKIVSLFEPRAISSSKAVARFKLPQATVLTYA